MREGGREGGGREGGREILLTLLLECGVQTLSSLCIIIIMRCLPQLLQYIPTFPHPRDDLVVAVCHRQASMLPGLH